MVWKVVPTAHPGVPKPGVFWVLTSPTFLSLQPPLFGGTQKAAKVRGAGEKFRR